MAYSTYMGTAPHTCVHVLAYQLSVCLLILRHYETKLKLSLPPSYRARYSS